MSKHICTHFCERLAAKCTTSNSSETGIFVLAVIFDFLGKCANVCIPACSQPTYKHTSTKPSLSTHTHPSNHTHTHSCGYYQRRSAEAPGLSGPHGVAVTRGGRAYLGPRPLPRPHALAPGAGRQMPCRLPVWRVSVAKANSV